MSKLSKEKLNKIKQSKNYTSKEIAEKTGIPKSTVEKIFGGFSKNPTLDILLKIADILDCGLDNFIEYGKEPESPFYKDRMIQELIEYIYEKKDLKNLVDIVKRLDNKDIQLITDICKRLSNNYN